MPTAVEGVLAGAGTADPISTPSTAVGIGGIPNIYIYDLYRINIY